MSVCRDHRQGMPGLLVMVEAPQEDAALSANHCCGFADSAMTQGIIQSFIFHNVDLRIKHKLNLIPESSYYVWQVFLCSLT